MKTNKNKSRANLLDTIEKARNVIYEEGLPERAEESLLYIEDSLMNSSLDNSDWITYDILTNSSKLRKRSDLEHRIGGIKAAIKSQSAEKLKSADLECMNFKERTDLIRKYSVGEETPEELMNKYGLSHRQANELYTKGVTSNIASKQLNAVDSIQKNMPKLELAALLDLDSEVTEAINSLLETEDVVYTNSAGNSVSEVRAALTKKITHFDAKYKLIQEADDARLAVLRESTSFEVAPGYLQDKMSVKY